MLQWCNGVSWWPTTAVPLPERAARSNYLMDATVSLAHGSNPALGEPGQVWVMASGYAPRRTRGSPATGSSEPFATVR